MSRMVVRTHLDRIHGSDPPQRQFSVNGSASFSLAPDGETLAWVELGNRAHGPLRITNLAGVPRRGRPALDNAVTASWSPDGASLAVLIDDDSGAAIVVTDRRGAALRRLSLKPIAHGAAPVWLDDHRIAAQTDDRTTYRWLDITSGDQGEIVDSVHGSTYWLARSPRDGTLAMWRNGTPGAAGARDEHLWIRRPDHEARPLHVAEAIKDHLLPSWSPTGELLVCALETGSVSRVALDTGELTPIAHVAPTPVSRLFDNHLMTLADGDLLAVAIELGMNVLAVRPDEQRPRTRREPDPGTL
jgi:hypothetical protein